MAAAQRPRGGREGHARGARGPRLRDGEKKEAGGGGGGRVPVPVPLASTCSSCRREGSSGGRTWREVSSGGLEGEPGGEDAMRETDRPARLPAQPLRISRRRWLAPPAPPPRRERLRRPFHRDRYAGGEQGKRKGRGKAQPPSRRAEPAGEREADTHPAAALPAHATPADTYQPYSPPPRVRDNGLTRSPRPRLAPPGPAPGRVGGRIKRGGARFWRALAAGPTCGPGRGREELPTSNSRKWPKQKEKNSDSRDRMMKDCSHPRGPLIHEEHVVFQRPVQTPRQAVMT